MEHNRIKEIIIGYGPGVYFFSSKKGKRFSHEVRFIDKKLCLYVPVSWLPLIEEDWCKNWFESNFSSCKILGFVQMDIEEENPVSDLDFFDLRE